VEALCADRAGEGVRRIDTFVAAGFAGNTCAAGRTAGLPCNVVVATAAAMMVAAAAKPVNTVRMMRLPRVRLSAPQLRHGCAREDAGDGLLVGAVTELL
jgi:hypothetical protein